MSGIVVSNATYGTTSSSVDVTKTVANSIRDGVLSVSSISPSSLNVEDPAPSQPKLLNVSYSINGGTSLSASARDGDNLYINAPPQRVASGLQIKKAEYGYPGNWTDVTNAVQMLVRDGKIDLKVGFSEVGLPDPNPNKRKELQVDYTINGASNAKTFKDGERFFVSAPASEGASNSTPVGNVTSGIGILFTNIARFMGMFLYTWSIFVAMSYGGENYKMLWGAIAFFLPLFAFWGIPTIAFFYTIFTGSKSFSPSVI